MPETKWTSDADALAVQGPVINGVGSATFGGGQTCTWYTNNRVALAQINAAGDLAVKIFISGAPPSILDFDGTYTLSPEDRILRSGDFLDSTVTIANLSAPGIFCTVKVVSTMSVVEAP